MSYKIVIIQGIRIKKSSIFLKKNIITANTITLYCMLVITAITSDARHRCPDVSLLF